MVESAEDNLDQGHTETEKVDEAPRDPDVGGESAAETTGDGSPVTTVAASGEVVEEDQRSQAVVTGAPTSVTGLDTSPGDSHQSGRRNRTPVVAVSAVALAIIVAAMLLFA